MCDVWYFYKTHTPFWGKNTQTKIAVHNLGVEGLAGIFLVRVTRFCVFFIAFNVFHDIYANQDCFLENIEIAEQPHQPRTVRGFLL